MSMSVDENFENSGFKIGMDGKLLPQLLCKASTFYMQANETNPPPITISNIVELIFSSYRLSVLCYLQIKRIADSRCCYEPSFSTSRNSHTLYTTGILCSGFHDHWWIAIKQQPGVKADPDGFLLMTSFLWGMTILRCWNFRKFWQESGDEFSCAPR